MVKINICLSTYNGENYLTEQIESIRQQTFTDWKLLIRDDGSSDGTIEIIQNFLQKESRIRFINQNAIKNINVHPSFYQLVKEEMADFYLFSDQDDVWKEDKLSIFMARAEQEDNSRSIMYYSNLSIVTHELNLIKEAMIERKAQSLLTNLVGNQVLGCVAMINHALAEKWIYTVETMGDSYHDSYLALLALALGKLIYIDEATIYYRQHENNILGDKTQPNKIKSFWEMIRSSQNRAKDIFQKYEAELPTENREIMKNFCQLSGASFFKRVQILQNYPFSRGTLTETILLRLLLATNYGKKGLK